jgi:hypothetical protein
MTDVYDIAFLAGGPDRVVDTAIVALVRSGRLRVHSPGQLATCDLTRRHPVEAAVLDAVGPTGHRSIDTIHWRVADDDRLRDVGEELHRAGLVGRTAALLHGHPHRFEPTRDGRRALRGAGAIPGADAEALRVAVGGRAAMSDARLRADIFERPVTTLAVGRPSRHDIDHSDPALAIYRHPAPGGTGDNGVAGYSVGGI